MVIDQTLSRHMVSILVLYWPSASRPGRGQIQLYLQDPDPSQTVREILTTEQTNIQTE